MLAVISSQRKGNHPPLPPTPTLREPSDPTGPTHHVATSHPFLNPTRHGPALLDGSPGCSVNGLALHGGVEESDPEYRPTKIPNIDPPKTPPSFMVMRPAVPSAIPSKLTLNFVLPYASELSGKEVDMVIIPTTTGQMGVLPGHVPTIAELKPGVLSVHEGNEVSKYFVSSGFAFIHSNSFADIVAVEAVPLDQIDANLVQKGLAEFTQKQSPASTDSEKAEAQIGVEVHSALNAALTG